MERRSSMCLREEGPKDSGEASTRPDQLSRRSSFHIGTGDLDSVGMWSIAHRQIYIPSEALQKKARYPEACVTQRSKEELRQILDQSAPDLISMTYTFSKGGHPLDGVVSESHAPLPLGRNLLPKAVPHLRHFGANRRSIEQPKKPVFMSVASTLRVQTYAQRPIPKKPV